MNLPYPADRLEPDKKEAAECSRGDLPGRRGEAQRVAHGRPKGHSRGAAEGYNL